MSKKVNVYQRVRKYNRRTNDFYSVKNHGKRVLRYEHKRVDPYDGSIRRIGMVVLNGEEVRVTVDGILADVIPDNAWNSVYSNWEVVK